MPGSSTWLSGAPVKPTVTAIEPGPLSIGSARIGDFGDDLDRLRRIEQVDRARRRRALLRRGPEALAAVLAWLGPASMAALLATLVLLFAFQGEAILQQPLVIALLAVPILIQVLFNSALAYGLNRAVGEKHNIACPSALIGASNFFELAVATAISLFGFHSGAALATVVGVLIEVPVMLAVVAVVNRSKGWYEARG